MKKIIILGAFISQVFAFAQSQDLVNLAKGDLLGFNAVFDQNDNLYGYVSTYGYGKADDSHKKFEYVFLDKNLNPVSNHDFLGDITAAQYGAYLDFRGKIILKPTKYDYNIFKMGQFVVPSSMEVDLKDNSVKKKVFYEYENNKFKEVVENKNWKETRKEDKSEKKEKGFNYRSYVFEIKEGGFLALEYNDYGSYVSKNSLMKFDDQKNLLWSYKYNTSGNKLTNESLNVLDKDAKNIYCILQHNNDKDKRFDFLVLDMQTGKEVYKKPIVGLPKNTMDRIDGIRTYSYGTVSNSKNFDDKIVLVGRNIEDNNKYSGFARLVLDKKTFATDTKIITYESLSSQIPKLGKNGTVESGYFLDPRDVFFLKDGSVGILLEKYKAAGEYSAPKTTDLVAIFTDKDFKTNTIKVFEKEKSKWSNSDYLFSQSLNDGNDVAFFYRDYQKDDVTKDKNWNLYINTLIGGKFTQEMVPISAKGDYMVYPYVGKEGYILLQEINEKQKFNKIRLERLNF